MNPFAIRRDGSGVRAPGVGRSARTRHWEAAVNAPDRAVGSAAEAPRAPCPPRWELGGQPEGVYIGRDGAVDLGTEFGRRHRGEAEGERDISGCEIGGQVSRYASAAPRADWAAVLERATGLDMLPDLSDAEIADVVSAAQRLTAWIQSLQVRAIGEAARRATDPAWVTAGIGTGDPVRDALARRAAIRDAEWFGRARVVAELALTTHMSEYAVAQRLDAALALREDRLRITAEGFAAGDLDWAKVCAVIQATGDLDDAAAAAVEAAALGPDAGWSNTPGLRRALVRARAAVDAAAAAVAGPAAGDAAGEEGTRDAGPGAAGPGDARPSEVGAADVGPTAAGPAEAGAADVGTAGGGPSSDGTGSPAGTSPFEDRRVVCDVPTFGVASQIMGAGFVWALLSATDMAMIDAVLDQLARSSKSPGDRRSHQQRRADAFVGIFANVRRSLWGAGAARGPEVLLTMSLETALGLADEPADLVGYGPVPAAMAREAATTGTWRCAVVDQQHGTLLGLGRSSFTPAYKPGGALDRFTRVRDQTCTFPGCHSRATDLDHGVKHRRGGVTCECNCARLCRRHHRLKDAGWFTMARSEDPDDPPGTLVWTTRSGRVHKRRPRSLTAPRLPRTGAGHSSLDVVDQGQVVSGRLAMRRPATELPDDPPF